MVTLQVVFLSMLSLTLASYVPKKIVEKPGTCPMKIGGVGGVCTSDCGNDGECPGEKKCCRIGCSTYCAMPDFSDVGIAGSAAIIEDRNTLFGTEGSSNGIEKSLIGLRQDNVESSRRFTQTGGRISTTFNTGIQGKESSIIDNLRRRSGFDDIGLTQDFGRNVNNRGISRGSSIIRKSGSSSATKHVSDFDGVGFKRSGQFSDNFQSIDRGMEQGIGETSVIGSRRGSVIKSSGGRATSVVDTFDSQRDSGMRAKSLLRQLNGGTSTRGGAFISASASASSAVGLTSGLPSADCHYECGKNKPCPVGTKCVQDGCHNICQKDLSSIGQSIGSIDNIGRTIIRSNQGEFGSRRSSVQGSTSILDNISGRSDGLTRLVSETGISGLTQTGSKKICRKQCKGDNDCRLGKICVTVNNCHRYCRRGPVKNNYKP